MAKPAPPSLVTAAQDEATPNTLPALLRSGIKDRVRFYFPTGSYYPENNPGTQEKNKTTPTTSAQTEPSITIPIAEDTPSVKATTVPELGQSSMNVDTEQYLPDEGQQSRKETSSSSFYKSIGLACLALYGLLRGSLHFKLSIEQECVRCGIRAHFGTEI